MRYRNDDVARELDQRVPHVLVDDRTALVAGSRRTDREVEDRLAERADVLREQVVRVKPDGREVAHGVELEHDLDRRTTDVAGVVLPADPVVALPAGVVRIESEVGTALDAVHQLAQTTGQVVVFRHFAVVGEVEEINLWTTAFSLGHVVRHDTIYNTESIHAERVYATRENTNFTNQQIEQPCDLRCPDYFKSK